MPTSNPRLMIVVTPEQRRLLAEIAKLQSRSSASIVRDLVDAATPMLRALQPVLQAADAATRGQPAQVQEIASQVIQAAYSEDQHAERDLAHLVNVIAGMLERDAGEGGDAGADRSDDRSEDRTDAASPTQPPYSNTGVRPRRQGGSRAARASAAATAGE